MCVYIHAHVCVCARIYVYIFCVYIYIYTHTPHEYEQLVLDLRLSSLQQQITATKDPHSSMSTPTLWPGGTVMVSVEYITLLKDCRQGTASFREGRRSMETRFGFRL